MTQGESGHAEARQRAKGSRRAMTACLSKRRKTAGNLSHVLLVSLAMVIFMVEIADALTLNDALNYKKELLSIYEGVSLNIEPGAVLDDQQKEKISVDRAKFQMKAYHDDPDGYLKYWVHFYEELGDRFSREVRVRDRILSSWHARLIAGVKDCYDITSSAVEMLSTKGKPNIGSVLADARLSWRIHQNAGYFHELEDDFRQILLPLCGSEKELQTFIRQMPIHLYIERTWK